MFEDEERLHVYSTFETRKPHFPMFFSTNMQALGFQALSGTGALRLGAEFLSRHAKFNIVYLPEPTWGEYWISKKNINKNQVPSGIQDF